MWHFFSNSGSIACMIVKIVHCAAKSTVQTSAIMAGQLYIVLSKKFSMKTTTKFAAKISCLEKFWDKTNLICLHLICCKIAIGCPKLKSTTFNGLV